MEHVWIQETHFLTWTCSWPLAKCHISKLVCKVFRIKVFRIEVVRINKVVFAVDDALGKHVNNPSFGDHNVRVGNLVIFGADSLKSGIQHIVSKTEREN